ncbi:MAG: hypothetical protein J6M93_04985 [Succinivibrio sp.]|nr:hypothetical protein [Succinivibrio sp.]
MLYKWLQPSCDEFKQAYLGGRLPGSVIIAASRQLGGENLALECAKLYLCHDPTPGGACGGCSSCRSFAAASHPDFIAVLSSTSDELDRGEDLTNNPTAVLENDVNDSRHTVRVDSLRQLSHWLNESAVGGERKCAIISNAHQMLPSAANSILKTFEEPPENTLIIMVSDSLSALLPTILSRAFKITVPEVKKETGLEFLKNSISGTLDLNRGELGLKLAANAPLGAKEYLEDGTVESCTEVIEALGVAVKTGYEHDAVKALLRLDSFKQALILNEFIDEVLKFKAGVSQAELPLLRISDPLLFAKLPATHLFKAHDDMIYIKNKAPFLPSRAPAALLTAWIKALVKG